MERPSVIYCQFRLAEDMPTCGQPREVQMTGNVPKFCTDHNEQKVRKQLVREYEEALAKETPDGDTDVPAEPEQDVGDAEEAPRVCRAHSCSIPLAGEWPHCFCPGHWRLLTTETKGLLADSKADPDIYEVAVLRGLREIGVVEG